MSKKNKIKASLIIIFAIILLVGTVFIFLIKDKNDVKQEEKIYVTSNPNKMIYFVGDDPNYEGLVIIYENSKGEEKEIPYTENGEYLIITGFDSTKTNQKLGITIKYKELTTIFYIQIKEFPNPTPILVGIYLKTLPKVEYVIGETLDTTGGILVKQYNDGTTVQINLLNEYVNGFSKIEKPGIYELKVIYNEGGISAETTYTITIESDTDVNIAKSLALQEAKNIYSEYLANFDYKKGEPNKNIIIIIDDTYYVEINNGSIISNVKEIPNNGIIDLVVDADLEQEGIQPFFGKNMYIPK